MKYCKELFFLVEKRGDASEMVTITEEQLDAIINRLHSAVHLCGHAEVIARKYVPNVSYVDYYKVSPGEMHCLCDAISDFKR